MKTFKFKSIEKAKEAIEMLKEHDVKASVCNKTTVKFANSKANLATALCTQFKNGSHAYSDNCGCGECGRTWNKVLLGTAATLKK